VLSPTIITLVWRQSWLCVENVGGKGEDSARPGTPNATLSATTIHSVMRARWALLLAAASASVHAGALEWHVALAGVPLTQFGLRTAPAVHPAGVIVTATQSNVLAGIHPDNGTLGRCLLRRHVHRS
jgi:hypothetical protein